MRNDFEHKNLKWKIHLHNLTGKVIMLTAWKQRWYPNSFLQQWCEFRATDDVTHSSFQLETSHKKVYLPTIPIGVWNRK